jgi:hypothetical protein
MSMPEQAGPWEALERCAAAARQIDPGDPRSVDRLQQVVVALDAAICGWGSPLDVAALRDAVGDHLVALSAAGSSRHDREAVARSLADLLGEASSAGSRTEF